MREIKFRAWNKKKQYFIDYSTMNIKICDLNNKNYQELLVFQQYTGLKDKNGKEIYEGDIVSYATYSYDEPIEDYEGVIKIGAYGTFIDGYNSNGDKDIYYLLEVSDCINHLEKLGNIYENQNISKEMREGN